MGSKNFNLIRFLDIAGIQARQHSVASKDKRHGNGIKIRRQLFPIVIFLLAASGLKIDEKSVLRIENIHFRSATFLRAIKKRRIRNQ